MRSGGSEDRTAVWVFDLFRGRVGEGAPVLERRWQRKGNRSMKYEISLYIKKYGSIVRKKMIAESWEGLKNKKNRASAGNRTRSTCLEGKYVTTTPRTRYETDVQTR